MATGAVAIDVSLSTEYRLWHLMHDTLPRFIAAESGPLKQPRNGGGRTPLQHAQNRVAEWLMHQQFEYRDSPGRLLLLPELAHANDSSTREFMRILQERFVVTEEAADSIARRMHEMVDDFRNSVEDHDGPEVDAELREHPEGVEVVVKDFETPRKPSNRMRSLVNSFGLDQTAKMLLRYSCLDMGSGLEDGDSITVFNAMYDRADVRYEAFASPLNSKLLHRPDAKFCSLFTDTDRVFGSLGNFFSVNLSDHPGGWAVNPPWVEVILEAAAQRIVDFLTDFEDAESWFFVNLPRWTDTRAWSVLDESEFKVDRIDMEPGSLMQTAYGLDRKIRKPYSIFVMGNLPDRVDLEELRPLLRCDDKQQLIEDWRNANRQLERLG